MSTRKDILDNINPDLEECPDYDLLEDDHEKCEIDEWDYHEMFLTPDAYEIFAELEAKNRPENAILRWGRKMGVGFLKLLTWCLIGFGLVIVVLSCRGML